LLGQEEEAGECGDDVVGLLERDRRGLDILSVRKGAKRTGRERYLEYRKVRMKRIYGVRVCLAEALGVVRD